MFGMHSRAGNYSLEASTCPVLHRQPLPRLFLRNRNPKINENSYINVLQFFAFVFSMHFFVLHVVIVVIMFCYLFNQIIRLCQINFVFT